MTEVLTQRSAVKRTGGFTLVELIAVIAVLLVIAILAVVQFTNLIAAAENAAIESDANAIARQLNTANSLLVENSRILDITDNGTTTPNAAPDLTIAGDRISWTVPPADSVLADPLNFAVDVPAARHAAVLARLQPTPATGATGANIVWGTGTDL